MTRVYKMLILIFLVVALCDTGLAETRFLPADMMPDQKIRQEIATALSEEFSVDGSSFDYLQKGAGEFLVLPDGGLFLYKAGNSPDLKQLLSSDIEVAVERRLFETPHQQMFLLHHQGMKAGTVTHWYSILNAAKAAQFAENDFYELYGFPTDSEGSGENGLEEGQLVNDIQLLSGADKYPLIIFRVVCENYKEKSSRVELMAFRRVGEKFCQAGSQKVIGGLRQHQ